MHRTHAAAALLAALALSSCAEVGKLAASAIEKPKLTFKAVRLRSLDLAAATLDFDFDVENPNGFGLQVAKATYAVEIEGTRVTAGDLPGGLRLPARKVAPLTVSSVVRFRDIPGIAGLLGKRDSIRYKLSGSVGVQTALGVLEVPFAREDELALPRLPEFRLEGLAVRSVSFDRIALEVRVRMANQNGFPLPAGKLRSAVSLAGQEVVKVEGARTAPVAAGGSEVLRIPLEVKLLEAGRAGADLARGAPVEIGLRGAAEVGGAELPIDLSARLPSR